MSNDMTLYTAAGAIARDASRTGRGISRAQSNGLIRQAEIRAELDVAIAKEDAVTDEILAGMGAIAQVGQAEQAVVLNMPNLSGRINPLAEDHALLTRQLAVGLYHRVRHL